MLVREVLEMRKKYYCRVKSNTERAKSKIIQKSVDGAVNAK